jgi:DNA repair protein RadC
MVRLIKYKTKLTENKRIALDKEIAMNCPGNDLIVRCPEDIVDISRGHLRVHEHSEEYMYMLCLNTKNRVIGVFEISHEA